MKNGKSYTATAYMRADTAQEVVIQLRLAGPPYTAYGLASKTLGTGWTKVTLTADAPVTSADVQAGLFVIPKVPGNIWLDSVTVTEGAATANTITRTGQSIGKTYFGLHNHRDVRWPDLGGAQGADRMWDGEGVQLRDIFPTSDLTKANWTAFDARIALAKQNGADLIMTLGGNMPSWASSDPTGQEVSCSLYTTKHDINGNPIRGTGVGEGAPPKDRTVWQNMVKAVVKRANGAIKYWEIWNEPYVCAMFNQRRPTDYTKYLVTLASDAYSIIKTNSSLTVLSPTLYTYKLDFVDEYLSQGGGSYADIIAIHAYDEYLDQLLVGAGGNGAANAPELLFVKEHGVNNLKNILARYNLTSKAIWNTESGYLASSNVDGTSNDTKGAPYVARHLLLASIAGLDRSYYYAWDQGGTSVTLGRETTSGNGVYVKTDAGTAYQSMAKWLTGTKIVSVSTSDVAGQPWVVKLSRTATGTTEYIVWNPMGTSVSYTPVAGMSYSSSLLGSKTALPAGTAVSVNGWPQLLTSY
ncbi:MAG: hypothetical protein EPO09_20335 [Aquabacterium sp.]|uniref:hypothetical protein n=1 Tax=Aquabacterium sp. TaxID=1872578 RepID=UPI0012070683|nr:hypothetical protein [Aquabacterium sp.]TAK85293.1 MAG: hypothetical protein EPO09_20335 [Aquabacterium sp.]